MPDILQTSSYVRHTTGQLPCQTQCCKTLYTQSCDYSSLASPSLVYTLTPPPCAVPKPATCNSNHAAAITNQATAEPLGYRSTQTANTHSPLLASIDIKPAKGTHNDEIPSQSSEYHTRESYQIHCLTLACTYVNFSCLVN